MIVIINGAEEIQVDGRTESAILAVARKHAELERHRHWHLEVEASEREILITGPAPRLRVQIPVQGVKVTRK